MLIPLGTDRARKRRPHATGAIIILNMVVYLIALALDAAGQTEIRDFMYGMAADREALDHHAYWTLLTYQFAHDPDGIFHLATNMIFLWIFGSALEDRLGHINFTLFYLMGGVVAGLVQLMTSSAGTIGASGSVFAVTGGFIVLFPRTRIKILFFFLLIGVYMIPSLWFVGFYIAMDFIGVFQGNSQVAHFAHLGGLLFGFLLALLLIATKIIKSDEYDLLYLIRQSRKRRIYRQVIKEAETSQQISAEAGHTIPVINTRDQEPEEMKARNEILQFMRQKEYANAMRRYLEAKHEFPLLELPENSQLEIANRLQAEGDRESAAAAYLQFLESHPTSRQIPEVKLLLSTLLIRSLDRAEEAQRLLEEALPELRDQRHLDLANRLLEQIKNKGDSTT
ncbi:MAG: hypothetical protein CMJ39_04720 [Phycisphaerae bacterium]|nr:hypothetical protein [Phycisphaerae bacterium]